MYLEVRPTCADGRSQCHEPRALPASVPACLVSKPAGLPASPASASHGACRRGSQSPCPFSSRLSGCSNSSTPSPIASLQQLIFCRPGRPDIPGSIALLPLPLEHFTSACLHQATVQPRQPQVQKPYPSCMLPCGRCVCVRLLPPHCVTTHLPTRICGYRATSPESEAKIYVFANFQKKFFFHHGHFFTGL